MSAFCRKSREPAAVEEFGGLVGLSCANLKPKAFSYLEQSLAAFAMCYGGKIAISIRDLHGDTALFP